MKPDEKAWGNRGSVLVYVLIAVTVLSLFAVSLLTSSNNANSQTLAQEQRLKSRNLAEAGLAKMYKDWTDVEGNLDGGTYTATLGTKDGKQIITAVGNSGTAAGKAWQTKLVVTLESNFNAGTWDKAVFAGRTINWNGKDIEIKENAKVHSNGDIYLKTYKHDYTKWKSKPDWNDKEDDDEIKSDNITYYGTLYINESIDTAVGNKVNSKLPNPIITPKLALTDVSTKTISGVSRTMNAEGVYEYKLNLSELDPGQNLLYFPGKLTITGDSHHHGDMHGHADGDWEDEEDDDENDNGDEHNKKSKVSYGIIKASGDITVLSKTRIGHQNKMPVALMSDNGNITIASDGGRARISGLIYAPEGSVTIGKEGKTHDDNKIDIWAPVIAGQDVNLYGDIEIGIRNQVHDIKERDRHKNHPDNYKNNGSWDVMKSLFDTKFIETQPKIGKWEESSSKL